MLPRTSNQQLSTLSPTGRLASLARLAGERLLRRRRVLYCPFTGSRHARMLEPLIAAADTYVVVTPSPAPAGAIAWDGRLLVVSCQLSVDVWPTADDLLESIDRGLRGQGVNLLEEDRARLGVQLEDQIRHVARVEADLKRLRPDALLLPTDNHSPFIDYALVARKLGIPCVMLQHGLDCERYYLNEAYASHIAVWGPARLERYRRESAYQPTRMCVTGNPDYDRPLPDGAGVTDHRCWLWATRPHRAEKCYPPSRRPDEGLRILEALLAALDAAPDCRLIIQPHPFDDTDSYRAQLAAVGATRVTLASDALTNLLMRCGLVITEDSTAGMDAMRSGAILVHAHFAPSAPVMPFVDYGAALPGFSGEELRCSLARAVAEPEVVMASQRRGRERFLNDYAGPRDGRSTERFMAFVKEILADGCREAARDAV